jgi:hypothetical protein
MTASPYNTHSITEDGKRTATKENRQYTKSDSLGAHNVFRAPNLNSLSINRKKGTI